MFQILLYILGFLFLFIWIIIKITFIALFDFFKIKNAFIKEIARMVIMYNIDSFKLQQYISDLEKQ